MFALIVQKWLIPVFAERAITWDFEISLLIFNGTAELLYMRARYLLYYPTHSVNKKINYLLVYDCVPVWTHNLMKTYVLYYYVNTRTSAEGWRGIILVNINCFLSFVKTK